TLEKPEVQVPHSAYSLVEELLQKARLLAKNFVTSFYKAKSEKCWACSKIFVRDSKSIKKRH
ncbi:33446_t:CDS:1, partial [Gigaspora margarita]